METKHKRGGLFSRKLSTYFARPSKAIVQQTSKVKPAPPPPRSFFASSDRVSILMPTKNIGGGGDDEGGDWKGSERANVAMIPYSEVDVMAASYISHMQESFRLEKMYIN